MDRVWTGSTRRLPLPVADDWDGFMSADYGTALSVVETWAFGFFVSQIATVRSVKSVRSVRSVRLFPAFGRPRRPS